MCQPRRPGTALDRAAQDRGTSIYLVDRVIPMLPRMLCEELCSLTAGVDHLTFSIGWRLDGVSHLLSFYLGAASQARCAYPCRHCQSAIVLDCCALIFAELLAVDVKLCCCAVRRTATCCSRGRVPR